MTKDTSNSAGSDTADETTPGSAQAVETTQVDAATDEWAEYPGRTLGVVALVLAFFSQIPALIMGIIAWVWSNKVGRSNVPAKVAVAVSATLLVLIALAVVGWVAFIASIAGEFGGGLGPDFMGPDRMWDRS